MATVDDSFLRACDRGDYKEARRLLSRGADPNVMDGLDWSALHWACMDGSVPFVKTLVEDYQCNTLECKDYLGRTPLFLACLKGHVEVAQYLVSEQHCNPQCRDSNGETPLHLACRWNLPNIAKFLLSPPIGCDANCTDNRGTTPLSLTNDANIIRELLLHGANPINVYEQEACGDALCAVSGHRPKSSVKMFVVGDVGAGKSSLTAALKKESKGFSRLVSRLTQVSGVEQKTAGIIPHEIASEKLGQLTLYDLAGHKEFYAGHDTVLRSTLMASSAVVFLLVADLAKSDKEFRAIVLYWLLFLENQYSSTGTKPHIIIIGSHADAVSSKVQKDKKAIIDYLASGPAFSSFYFAGFVAMDCRFSNSSSMSELRKCLAKSCESLRDSSTLSFQSHCLLVYLLDQFRHLPAVSLGEILSHIQQHSQKEESDEKLMISRRMMPNDARGLYQSCEELNKRGNLLFLGNIQNPQNSWLVLDKELLLTHVTGSVFAPESFRQHHKLASNTGVVPHSSMVAHFPGLDPNMIACFLSHFDFCYETTDHSVLQLLQSSSSSAQEKYYFFPALISIDAPPEVWNDSSKFRCHSAWLLQCSQAEQFFTPRFLHVLLLRLAFSFALASDTQEVSSDRPSLQRKCSVWKNGIYWRNRQGVEALVEVGKDSQRATVMVRSRKGREIASIHLRTALLQTVLKIHKQFCPRVTTSESFLHPDDASSYPLRLKHSPHTITEIARAVAEGAPYVVADNELALTKNDPVLELETLLHFEPYAHLGEAILLKLFDEASLDYTKPADAKVIERIVHYVKLRICHSPGVFNTPADILQNLISKSHSNVTYRDLRVVLDQFSVFAGRNPLEITGQLSPLPTDATEIAKQHLLTPAQGNDSTPPSYPLEIPGQLSLVPTDAIVTRAKQHLFTSAQGNDSMAPAHSDVSTEIPRKSNKPRLDELQRLRGREGSVIKVIKTVAHRWDDLAVALHFNHEEKAAIQRNTFFHDEAACEEVLGEWLNGEHCTPVTWDTLLEALRDCDFTVLARDLEEALH